MKKKTLTYHEVLAQIENKEAERTDQIVDCAIDDANRLHEAFSPMSELEILKAVMHYQLELEGLVDEQIDCN